MPDSKQPVNVWLIEDHKTYGERLMRALNRLDDVRCEKHFTACEDALTALGKNAAPQVLLLDVGLPGMSGIEGLALLRQQARKTALVILTVFEDDDKIFRAICAGAAGYLLKTSSIEDIAAAIRTAAAGGSPINPTIARRVLEMFSKANPPARDYGLTPREQEILEVLVQGKTIKEAAAALKISYYTADEYIRSVYDKLQVRSRSSAVAKAVSEGLVPPRGQ
ncbi:two component transcriptional regulator, LuxR family [Chthoniobacter flavus Ellin428]|uniref:Two component transcriptional regulator, LuxR family n=1 Tax=Chthoniobacter flavus Ellin428 TaxID=497964 RepID=B4D1S7_9BACT|nr:response regulator transcription factor [Chthoniobacter flavus]EDY19689.1 two component transcriptional regulator, LuxR family [Chthoniobacter flavus Ellin428]TCO92922.1 LuxR family two component transcriptional regulator [Chthoniobacter flavus]